MKFLEARHQFSKTVSGLLNFQQTSYRLCGFSKVYIMFILMFWVSRLVLHPRVWTADTWSREEIGDPNTVSSTKVTLILYLDGLELLLLELPRGEDLYYKFIKYVSTLKLVLKDYLALTRD